MVQVVRLYTIGGVEGFRLIDVPAHAPGPGEVAIRQTAIGVNFIDIYQRLGVYPLPLPAVLGVEGAGVIAALGSNVGGLRVGDRVAYAGAPVGAYAAERVIPAWRAVPLPAAIPDELTAAGFIRGLTAHMLLTATYRVGPGTTMLVHAAAGGLGSLLAQWGKRLGAVVIGTVGSQAKAEVARASGCEHVIVGRDADYSAGVAAALGVPGVDVAYDGIGGSALLKTLACIKPFGTAVSIGQAAGPIPPLSVEELGPRRSISLARPSVMAYSGDRPTYLRATAELLAIMQEGVRPVVGSRYPLSQAAKAHVDLESGVTTGSPLLMP